MDSFEIKNPFENPFLNFLINLCHDIERELYLKTEQKKIGL